MTHNIPGYTIKRPKLEDAPAVLALVVACDIAEHGEPDTELDEITADWEEADLDKDAWLVFGEDASLVGYGFVSRGPKNFTLEVCSHPAAETGDLNLELLAACERRAAEMASASEENSDKEAVVYTAHSNTKKLEVLQASGYQEVMRHYIMQADIGGALPAPSWPEGAVMRTMQPGLDDRAVFDFIYENFDWPGRGPAPEFDWWKKFMMRPDHFIPEIWFLLEKEQEIIGAALCFDYPETGWVRQFAANNSLRRQGIGKNLLAYVFQVFKERGHQRVSLAVESDNPAAHQFYLDAGMHAGKQFDQYKKLIKAQI